MPRLRLVFMGTPDLAATCLSRLLTAPDLEVVAAVSQPDRPKGRHLQLAPTPVKQCAQHAGIPVLQPLKARDPEFLTRLKQLAPDLIAVAAYGQILPQALLDIPRHGCLNLHTSLLPRYRGAAPIQWAILNGDGETGVTIMKIVPELDAGDIVSQTRTPITEADDAQTLHDRLATLGADLLVSTLPDYCEGRITPLPQPAAGVVYARKIRKEDGLVDWTRPAIEIWNQVRGLVPWPGAFTYLPAVPAPDHPVRSPGFSRSSDVPAESPTAPKSSSAPQPPDPSVRSPGFSRSPAAHAESLEAPTTSSAAAPAHGPHGPLLKLWKAKPEASEGVAGRILRADKDGIVIGCGTGALCVLELQREGGRRMSAAEFLAGHTLKRGDALGVNATQQHPA